MPMIIPIDAGCENHIGAQLRDCRVRQFSRGEDHCKLSAGTLAPGDDECTGTRAQTPTASQLPFTAQSAAWFSGCLTLCFSLMVFLTCSHFQIFGWFFFFTSKYLISFLLFDILILEMKGYPIWLTLGKHPYDHYSKLATVNIPLYLPSEPNKTLHSPFQLETPWVPFPKLLSKSKNTQWWVSFHSMFYTLNNNQNITYVCFIYINDARVYISFFFKLCFQDIAIWFLHHALQFSTNQPPTLQNS